MEIETTDAAFEKDVIQQSKKIPVIVDFWAPWCPPCKILKPLMEKIATSAKYNNKLVLAKLNVEENKTVASKYDIMSIPAVKMFKNGKVVDQFIGFQPESEVIDWIEKNL